MRCRWAAILLVLSGTLPITSSSVTCGGRLSIRFAQRQRCRLLHLSSCTFFYIVMDGRPRPCTVSNGRCIAGDHRSCLTRTAHDWTSAGAQAQAAARRHRQFQQNAFSSQVGRPCASAVGKGDTAVADCETWCISQDPFLKAKNIDAKVPCDFCKCRACRACHAFEITDPIATQPAKLCGVAGCNRTSTTNRWG